MRQGTYLQIPEPSDRGSVFCPAISANLDIIDLHIHDGISSEAISSKHIEKSYVDLLLGGWVSHGENEYKQTVTLPSGYVFDTSILKYLCISGVNIGSELCLTAKKVSSNSFEVYTSFPDFSLRVVIS